MALRETIARSPDPTNEPIPEKKKNRPIIALCIERGAAEYANSRPTNTEQINDQHL